MKETYNNSSENSDELDLIVLFEKLVSFLKRFAKVLIYFTLIGIIAGIVLFLSATRKYPSTLILHSNTLTNLENIQIIASWKELLKKTRSHCFVRNFGLQSCDTKKGCIYFGRGNSKALCRGQSTWIYCKSRGKGFIHIRRTSKRNYTWP